MESDHYMTASKKRDKVMSVVLSQLDLLKEMAISIDEIALSEALHDLLATTLSRYYEEKWNELNDKLSIADTLKKCA
jgi:hypothetical protein